MRFAFLLVMIIGAAVGFGYPYAIKQLSDHEMALFRVYDTAGGFRGVEANLAASDAPVRIALDMTGSVPAGIPADRSLFTLTVATAGRTILAETVGASGAEKREVSPQTANEVYRVEAGAVSDITDGRYLFTVGAGDAEGVQMTSVDLLLFGGFGVNDPRAQPVGLSIMAVGFIGFVISLRRRARAAAAPTPAEPARQRWGRGPTTPS